MPTLYIVDIATHLHGIWIPMTGFMVSLLLAPKFQIYEQMKVKNLHEMAFCKRVRE